MYISYDDFAIETFLVGIEELEEEVKYDNIYQYDELGANYTVGTGNPTIYAANIFTRKTINDDVDEYLNEVGIYLLDTEGIEVYLSENGDLSKLRQVAAPGALEAGYHTIELSSPQKLTNEKFAIVIKYTNSEGASMPIEANLRDSNLTFVTNQYSTATANEGESKYSTDGTTWNELNDTKVSMIATLKNTNNCIKGFTTYQEKSATVPVTGVEITEKNVTLDKGNTANIVATVTPENASNKNVTWSSSDENIAKVVNGALTGISEGTATITVTTEDGGKTDTCTVTVTENEPEEVINVTGVELVFENFEGEFGVKWNEEEQYLRLGINSTLIYNAKVTPENATNKNITWSSSDENIAKVSNGVITGVAEGTATITVTTEDGNKTASITVKVEPTIPVESVTLNKEELEMQVGDETNLVVSFNPSNASNKNVRWTSSDEKVATISETGIIKAVAEGKTTITVTSEDGNKTATCELTVVKKTNSDDDIYKSDGNNTIKDTTTAKVELPNTGLRIMLIVLGTVVVLIGVVAFIKYRKYTDIK